MNLQHKIVQGNSRSLRVHSSGGLQWTTGHAPSLTQALYSLVNEQATEMSRRGSEFMWIFHFSRSLSFLTCTSTHPYPIPVFLATPVLGWKPGSAIFPVSYISIHDPYVYRYRANSDLLMKDTQAETVFVGNEERIEQELTKLTHEESLIQSSN